VYEKLIHKLGSLHSLLRELESAELYQGEHTIVYSSVDGTRQMLHVYIDGTDLQLSNTPLPKGDDGLSFSLGVTSDED
jgi:hypothetical protein